MSEIVTVNGDISDDVETENEHLTSTPAPTPIQSRRGKRQALREHFLGGTARIGKCGRFSDSLASSFGEASSSLDTSSLNEAQKARTSTCAICPSILLRLQNAFEASGLHSKDLLRRKAAHRHPKKAAATQHRNLKEQNEWIKRNLLDSQGNYSYCLTCITVFFNVSKQRLTSLRSIKRKEIHSPLAEMSKHDVSEQKLVDCVVMPQDEEHSFKQWWDAVALDEAVSVKVPHAEHGLARKASNHAKTTCANVRTYVQQIIYYMKYTCACNMHIHLI